MLELRRVQWRLLTQLTTGPDLQVIISTTWIGPWARFVKFNYENCSPATLREMMSPTREKQSLLVSFFAPKEMDMQPTGLIEAAIGAAHSEKGAVVTSGSAGVSAM